MECGFRSSTVLFFDHALTQSGIIRSADQSPPPITFHAREDAIRTLLLALGKYDRICERISNSAAPLDAL